MLSTKLRAAERPISSVLLVMRRDSYHRCLEIVDVGWRRGRDSNPR
jgi:hypothetical protein